MEAFKLLKFPYGEVALDPQHHGGAFLSAENEYATENVTVELTRLELVALRDWLIAYTG